MQQNTSPARKGKLRMQAKDVTLGKRKKWQAQVETSENARVFYAPFYSLDHPENMRAKCQKAT